MLKLRHCVGAVALILATLILTASPVFAAQKPTPAGRIKIVSGSVLVVRGGTEIPAQAGQMVFQADVLRTGTDGRIGITLEDDTRISLGPSSEARLDRFVYKPAQGLLGLALRVSRGVAAYVSGRIAKLAPDSIRLETPAAIVGVRGTTLAIRVLAE
jgi:hypothetical protein